MPRLRLRLFGGFSASLHDRGSTTNLRLPTRKAEAMLAYLAMPLGERRRRGILTALLWGAVPESQGRHSLRQTLTAVRNAFGPSHHRYLIVEDDAVYLNRACVWADADAFFELVGQRRRRPLRLAFQLYRGDVLAGLDLQEPSFDHWLSVQRARVRDLAFATFESCVTQFARGDDDVVLRSALHLLEIDPLHEGTHRVLMRLYAQRGRYSDVLRQFAICRKALIQELGVEPDQETHRLLQSLMFRRGHAGRE